MADSQSSMPSEILNQLIETFGATEPDQVLNKVLELQETSRLVEDELQKMQEAMASKEITLRNEYENQVATLT